LQSTLLGTTVADETGLAAAPTFPIFAPAVFLALAATVAAAVFFAAAFVATLLLPLFFAMARTLLVLVLVSLLLVSLSLRGRFFPAHKGIAGG